MIQIERDADVRPSPSHDSDVKVYHNHWHRRLSELTRGLIRPKLWLPDFPNGITDEGIHLALDSTIRGNATITQISTWYAGLIDNAGFTGVANSDTMASHTGWSESSDYSEANRITGTFSAPATRATSATFAFSINATKTFQGLFITSNNTKGGTTGTLFSTALFSTQPSLSSGNVLTSVYTLSD